MMKQEPLLTDEQWAEWNDFVSVWSRAPGQKSQNEPFRLMGLAVAARLTWLEAEHKRLTTPRAADLSYDDTDASSADPLDAVAWG